MKIIKIINKQHVQNNYLIIDNEDAILIDGSATVSQIEDNLKISVEKEKLKAIFLTHCHADHIGALKDLLNEYDVAVYGHTQDLENINKKKVNCKAIVGVRLDTIDTTVFEGLNGGESITVSDMDFDVISTPRSY